MKRRDNVSIVVAIAQNGMIGCANKLLWHISEDLKHFKNITSGGVVIMGRKTYESIGKPLPNRRNIIISRNTDYNPSGCEVYSSIESVLDKLSDISEIFIIGGGEIYKQTLPIASKLYLTVVEKDYDGDTKFPDIDFSEWELIKSEHFDRGEKYDYPFVFSDYIRK